MSPRSRTIADVDVLRGVSRVVGRLGPSRMTLADVAAEVGLAPATLIQRFGSKRGLLLALAQWAAESSADPFERARQLHTPALEALVTGMVNSTPYMTTPEELANHLAFLQSDLSDDEFYPVAHERFAAERSAIHALLDEALRAGELAPQDTEALASLLQAQLNGALLTWAIYRDGPLQDWVRHHLEGFLAPRRLEPPNE